MRPLFASSASYTARSRYQKIGRTKCESTASWTTKRSQCRPVTCHRQNSNTLTTWASPGRTTNEAILMQCSAKNTSVLKAPQERMRSYSSTTGSSPTRVLHSSSHESMSVLWETLGFSAFVAGSLLLLSSASSNTSRLEEGKKATKDEDRPSSFPHGVQGSNNNGTMLATSALYLDPRLSLNVAIEEGWWKGRKPGGGDDGGGRKDGDNDRSDRNENKFAEIAPSNSSHGQDVYTPYDLSVRAIKGNRLTMEDTFFVAPGGRFVAVFDGHGGSQVSSYLQENLFRIVTEELKRKRWEIDDISPQEMDDESNTRTQGASIASHVAALRSAFNQVESHVLGDEELNNQGSTAVAVWVHEGTDGLRTLVSANVGDSRAILSRNGKAVDLTYDHKPNEEREKARIKRHGGTIEWDALAKVHRVESLSLSRAIGDAFAKPMVSGEVDIRLFPVVEEKDEFMLLASDGLWDVMSSQDVVSYVRKRFETELSRKELTTEDDVKNYRLVLRKNMARSIVREAVRRGTGDNVCVLIVWLNDDFFAPSTNSLSKNQLEDFRSITDAVSD